MTQRTLPKGKGWILFLPPLALLVSILIALVSGAGDLNFSEVIRGLFSSTSGTASMIVRGLRLPRIVAGIAVGGGLSLAGVLLQGLFRNPLVEPYTLGISGGSVLMVALVITFGLHTLPFSLPLAGFVGALLVVGLIVLWARSSRGRDISRLLLAGVMISFITSSFVILLLSIGDKESLHAIVFWVMGSLDEPSWLLILFTLLVSLLGLLFTLFNSKPLNALLLGEESARSLGINVDRKVMEILLTASLITGTCVALAGVIGFIGLVVPHFCRLWLGANHHHLTPASFFCGAAFLIACDTLARTFIQPSELPVGVITGIIGGILFMVALLPRDRQGTRP